MFATIIGPYPADPGASSEQERLAAVLGDQQDAGLGLLTDGRVHRVVGTPGPVVGAWHAAHETARGLAAHEGLEAPLVKACLVGPWTLGEGDPARVRAAAADLGGAIEALFEAGAPVVQLTEPRVGSIDASDVAAIDLLSEVLDRLASPVAGHGHLCLALAGGGPTRVPAERLALGFSSYLFDLIASPDDWRACARMPAATGLIVGVVDPGPGQRADKEVGVWGARYAASMGGRGPARIGVCPGAGIERLDRHDARAVLELVAEVGRSAGLPDRELVQELDPRAINARAAALGQGELPPRRRWRTDRP